MRWRSLACALLVSGVALVAAPAQAATVVDNCSSYEGTGGLQDALIAGGDIVFACDGVIGISGTPSVNVPTSIDAAGHDVTLDGLGNTIFLVEGTTLRLTGLRLVAARGSALRVQSGSLIVEGCRFEDNAAAYRRDSVNAAVAAVSGATPAGGAIRADDSAVTITRSIFNGNFATQEHGMTAGLGGAVAVFGGSLAVEDSRFDTNATRGPGLGIDRGSGGAIWVGAGTDSLAIAGSTFIGNTAGMLGGAIWSGAASLVVSSTTFESNATGLPVLGEAGGGAVAATSTATISDSAFTRNDTGGSGGALLLQGPATVTASTFTGNRAGGAVPFVDGGIVGTGSGGAIASPAGPATIADSTFADNSAAIEGGAVLAHGGLTVHRSTFQDNELNGLIVTRPGGGGAISASDATVIDSVFNRNDASRDLQEATNGILERPPGGAIQALTLIVAGSSFSFNAASGAGGALHATTASVTTSSLSHNVAGEGGGAIKALNATVDSSTLAFNVAGLDGGGLSALEAAIVNSTLYGNTSGASQDTRIGGPSEFWGAAASIGLGSILNATIADNGGALGRPALVGNVTLVNTIVAGDPAGANCDSRIVDGGHNIDSGSTCPFAAANASMSDTDPMLRGLADNGGPTRTVATHRNSPAIDAGDTTACPARDQRNRARLGACDIGAYENRSG